MGERQKGAANLFALFVTDKKGRISSSVQNVICKLTFLQAYLKHSTRSPFTNEHSDNIETSTILSQRCSPGPASRNGSVFPEYTPETDRKKRQS